MTIKRGQNKKNTISRTKFKSNGRLPDFLIIGAMKSGTTSLFQSLDRHPQIFLAKRKEIQYFSRDHIYAKGENFYRDHFVDARKDQLIGEASACYSRWPLYPQAAERIAARLPDIHLIYVMRHPVERAYSHYGHIIQERMFGQKEEMLTFEAALEEDRDIIDTSMYMVHIERYLALFPREQMLFLTLDELKSKPQNLLRKTQEFLGVDLYDLTAQGEIRANQWGDATAETRIKNLINSLKKTPVLSHFVKNIIPTDTRQRLKEKAYHSKLLRSLFNTDLKDKNKCITPLSLITRKLLLKKFEKSTTQLEKFLGYNLDNWHK